MRAESAVEPTRSENITVTWRRSARSSGCGVRTACPLSASADGGLPSVLARKAAMASRSLTPSCFRWSSVKLGSR